MVPVVAVVIPCYRVRRHVLGVLGSIGKEVARIYVVDDACPEGSGRHVLDCCVDPRVQVLFHDLNQGVGGAVITGYQQAVADGVDVIVKLDGDGQMDPALIRAFIAPILNGHADYTKGNRFHNIESVRVMPKARLLGNAILSFMTKISTGYWVMFDPTNGMTAISAVLMRELPLHKISRRYFFESDMLFRLGTLRASVVDIPMAAVYGEEVSNLRIGRVLPQFLLGHFGNLGKRLLYSYFLRDFSVASLLLLFGFLFLTFGTVFGLHAWFVSVSTKVYASTGTVMFAALPVILGIQFLLSFLAFDMAATPSRAIHPLLRALRADDIEPGGESQMASVGRVNEGTHP